MDERLLAQFLDRFALDQPSAVDTIRVFATAGPCVLRLRISSRFGFVGPSTAARGARRSAGTRRRSR
jgi:hypothetical protein